MWCFDRARLECVPRIHKQDKLREARKLKRKKYLDEIDFPSLLEHFQAICVLNKLLNVEYFLLSGGGFQASNVEKKRKGKCHSG